MNGKVQQHMYTRERKGLFHNSPGYDTIAISKGLEPSFVKNYLHPFCFYHGPRVLRDRGEKDPSYYPPAVTIFQPDTGDLVIGQAVFVPADFTGTRSTYFMHNYVIPSNLKEDWIDRPEKIFQLKDFHTCYDLRNGPVLPELDAVPLNETKLFENQTLKSLGIEEDAFQQLLLAVMISISGKKKVFISLRVAVQDYTKYALRLLEMLFSFLPYSYRRKLGAITFTSEPEVRNWIHVTFFEPGTLNVHNRIFKNQLVFNFAGGSLSRADNDLSKHKYLELVSKQRQKSQCMDDFFRFADMALAGLSDGEKLSILTYDQLIDLYVSLKEGDLQLYYKDKPEFLSHLVKFLKLNSEEKPELISLMLKIFEHEKSAEDRTIALIFTEAVVSITNLLRFDESRLFLLNILSLYQKEPLFLEIWKILEQDKITFKSLVCFISEQLDYKYLLKHYLTTRMDNLKLEDIRLFGDIIPDDLVAKINDETTREQFLLLNTLFKLVNFPKEQAFTHLDWLSRNARDQLNKFLRIILRDYALPERFGLLFVAFETSGNRVDYPKLLNFIISYYDVNTMCSFIIENANLAVSDLHFRKALKAYLTDHPKSIWKDKTQRKELYAVNNDHLKILVKEVEKDTANLLVRLIKRTGINR